MWNRDADAIKCESTSRCFQQWLWKSMYGSFAALLFLLICHLSPRGRWFWRGAAWWRPDTRTGLHSKQLLIGSQILSWACLATSTLPSLLFSPYQMFLGEAILLIFSHTIWKGDKRFSTVYGRAVLFFFTIYFTHSIENRDRNSYISYMRKCSIFGARNTSKTRGQ